MGAFKLCLALLATCSLRIASASCEYPNGFQQRECGSRNATLGGTLQCCASTEACIEVEDIDGAIHGECSSARSLDGKKAVFIVLVPLIGFTASSLAAVYMVWHLKVKTSRVTQLCLAQLCLSWPLYLTRAWPMGFYAIFLSVLTAYCCLWKGAVGWLYRAVWIMQIFNVVAYFGAYEAFHVPFFGLSGSGGVTGSEGTADSPIFTTQSMCTNYYGNYFTILSLERITAKGADPSLTYYGLCSLGWLGFAQVMWVLQGLHWAVTCGVCMPVLTKVDPSVDTNFGDLKVAP